MVKTFLKYSDLTNWIQINSSSVTSQAWALSWFDKPSNHLLVLLWLKSVVKNHD